MPQYTMFTTFSEIVHRSGIEAAARMAVNCGCSSVEILEDAVSGCPRDINDPVSAAGALQVLRKYGLRTACYSVCADLYSDREAVESLKRHAEMASALECPYLHHTVLLRDRQVDSVEETLHRAAEVCAEIAAYAAPLGVTCLYEDQGRFTNGIVQFGMFYREVQKYCTNVGVCGDIGNTLAVGEAPQDFLRAFADQIRHVHIKDCCVRLGGECPGPHWNRYGDRWIRDCMVGEGQVDLAACINVLQEIGYTGPLSLELSGDMPFAEMARRTQKVIGQLWRTI